MTDLIHGLAVVTCAEVELGRALALELVRRGIRVAGFGREHALEETADLAGPGFRPCHVDVSSAKEVSGMMDRLAHEMAPVTILINNASVHPRRDFLDETPETFMQTMALNLGSIVNCSHAALRQMVHTGQGRILNVFAAAETSPFPAQSAYVVSDVAARSFTRALRADIEDRFPDIIISDWITGPLALEPDHSDGSTSFQIAAAWGVELALWTDTSLRGSVWERDHELLPSRSFKRQIKDTLLMRPTKARCLGGARQN
ncbi:SDR family oxidoreductase [Hydrogenophaga sp.]|uniref:SDR family oxidoreductase n=1 Tax=Hydrogenophaga sp. TaxID=1904254 RepID=UPI003F724A16